MAFGAQASWIKEKVPEGREEQPIYADPVQGHDPTWRQGKAWLPVVWHSCQVVALFEAHLDKEAMEGMLRDSKQAAGVEAALETQWSEVFDEDWEAQVKASYVPVQLTPRLWIVPEWCEPPDAEATNVMLKPGIAFGTGEHPTTRMCLRFIEGAHLQGSRLLDYGCGSGILAVAACKYGAKHVVAVDIDPLAVRATRSNAELNDCTLQCQVVQGGPFASDREPLAAAGLSLPTAAAFDVCVANILRPALLDLKERLCGYVRPGGTVVLSGLLNSQVDDIQSVYAESVLWKETLFEGEWAMLVGTKR